MMKCLRQTLLSVIVMVVFIHDSEGVSFGLGRKSVAKHTWTREETNKYRLEYPFTQCSNGMEGRMIRIALSPCPLENGRFSLTRGESVILDLDFISYIPAANLIGSLKVGNYWISYNLGPTVDLCNSSSVSCPIKANQTYNIRTRIPIQETSPAGRPDVKVLIQDENSREIACAIVPVRLEGAARDDLPNDRPIEVLEDDKEPIYWSFS